MSSCEKCWADAERETRATGEEDAYHRLLRERAARGETCTPEQQAGPDATECRACGRRAGHQHTGECMVCHRENRPTAFKPGDRVVYRPKHGPAEEGSVTSANDAFVFVCYGLPGSTSKATQPWELEFVAKRAAAAGAAP